MYFVNLPNIMLFNHELLLFKINVYYSVLCYCCSATIYANRHYLNIYHRTHPQRLAVNAVEKPKIIGDVFIHPLAVVHPTATVSLRNIVILAVIGYVAVLAVVTQLLFHECCSHCRFQPYHCVIIRFVE